MPRFAWPALIAAFAVAATAVLLARASRADDAEDAFRQTCGGCHRNPGALARRNPGRNAGSRGERWDTFLRAHHAPDPVQRALIVEFLERSR
jgi:hypothetical protein